MEIHWTLRATLFLCLILSATEIPNIVVNEVEHSGNIIKNFPVPDFEALFELEGRDWQRFYDQVKRLAKLPRDQRHQALTSRKKSP